MHTPFDPEHVDWTAFLDHSEDQTGAGYATFVQQFGGGGGGTVGYTYFEGIPYQRGAGIGGVFRSIFRALLPLGKQAVGAVGREGLATAARVLQNAVQQQADTTNNNNNNNIDWKQNIARETRTGVSNLLGHAADHLRKQNGSGRGRSRRITTAAAATARKKPIKATALAPAGLLFSRKGPTRPRQQRRGGPRIDSLGVY